MPAWGGPEEFNLDVLRDHNRNLLAEYLGGNISVFRCPADKRMGRYQGTNAALASFSTVMEWTNAKAVSEDQAKSITSFLLPNQGMGTGWLANPEATRNGLWARLSKVTWTRASSMVTVAETSRRLRKSFLA